MATEARLTAPQRAALELLGAHPADELDGWKQSTAAGPIPRVNYRAAESLRQKGLVSCRLPHNAHWSPYTHDYVYSLTDRGREFLARDLSERNQ